MILIILQQLLSQAAFPSSPILLMIFRCNFSMPSSMVPFLLDEVLA